VKRLFFYFREKPIRVFYAAVWLGIVILIVYKLLSVALQAEFFSMVVANPDHRMVKGDKHFSGLNSDNIRSPHEPKDIKDSDFNIVVLGDSFIYGFLMSSELSPPVQMEKILRDKYQRNDINVINFGWTSSSPYLSFRLLKDIGEHYKPDLVLMAVDMSDYRDEWVYKSIIEGRGIYHYVKLFPRTAFFIKKFMEWIEPVIDIHTRVWGYSGAGGYFVARQPMEKSMNLFDTLYGTLVDMNDYTVHTLHVPFVVLLPPRHWQYTADESPQSWENGSFDALGPYALENYRYFDGKRPSTSFPMISFLEDFKNNPQRPLTFAKDSHWNKYGARFFAERVVAHCEALGLFDALKQSNSTQALPQAATNQRQ
jgi:hypothetical protein